MIKEIVTDPDELCVPSFDAPPSTEIERDLMDTARHYNALGLSASQIGYQVRTCVILIDKHYKVFVNPELKPKLTAGRLVRLEGCLSFPDKPSVKVRRWKEIRVRDEYSMGEWVKYKGVTARILQHENDHFDGVLI
jgi:peptide deformylase